MKRQKWLNLTGSEVMKSNEALLLISIHVGSIKEVIGNPDNTLVVGCADGTEMNLWDKCTGIDLNDESLAKSSGNGFIVHKMDMHDMTFKDGEFSLVSSRDVFEHAVSSIEAISEMARVSSKYVAITVPDSSWQYSAWHFIIPTMKQMITLGEKVGLMLKAYREYGVIQGSEYVKQYLYIFQKEDT